VRSASRFGHLRWPLGDFGYLESHDPRPYRRFPIRFMRYWMMRSLLQRLHAELGRPISLLEIGVDRAQMMDFVCTPRAPGTPFPLPEWLGRWDGVDVHIMQEVRDRFPYTSLIEADVEQPFALDEQSYDVVVTLHVLEHLFDPEATLRLVSKALRPGGLLIGGSPTMPGWIAAAYEPLHRRSISHLFDDIHAHRHLSTITPSRIARFAREEDFDIELLTGAFLFRATGSTLEDKEWWVRANQLWGALFPSLGAEVYFSLRQRVPGAAKTGAYADITPA
jgi:SAM-dependent methyltransferase